MSLLLRMSLLVLFTMGCATGSKQHSEILSNDPSLPAQHLLSEVPFLLQEANQCGPATLSMAMNFYGKDTHPKDFLASTYSEKQSGSLQIEMLLTAREQGFLALPIHGMSQLLKEVSADHPVIIFQNLGLSWFPQWHYALVTGYDLAKPELILHSGPTAFKKVDYNVFEHQWRLGHFWGLVIIPAGEISPSATELEHIRAIAAIEELGFLAEAELAYKSVLKVWPQSLGAHLGLSNTYYSKAKYEAAANYLKAALKYHPGDNSLIHNLDLVRLAIRSKSRL